MSASHRLCPSSPTPPYEWLISDFSTRIKHKVDAPKLDTEVLLNIVVIPVVLPQLVPATLSSTRRGTSKLSHVCL
jgi:hypothetical protein